MPRVKLTIEYNGAGFHGWQIQPKDRTVQGELTKALETVLRVELDSVCASGRTDAGVHARGQVVSFDLPEGTDLSKCVHSVNGLLKGEVAIVDADVVADTFHARHSATQKLYTYTIINRSPPPTLDADRMWHVASKLDVARLREEAHMLLGTHDYKSFQAATCQARTTLRTIEHSEFVVDGAYLVYRIKGNGFLKQMVRTIVGTLVEFGRGKRPEDSMSKILEAQDRTRAGLTAPAHGLCLEWVKYPELS